MIFIGLEISSIASYILAGYLRDDARNNEAGAEILPAGIVRHGVPAVRRGVDLRRHRIHQSDGDPPRVADFRSSAARALIGPGGGADVRRTSAFKISAAPFQVLGPGRLSRRARAGLRVPHRRPQGRGLRGSAADLPRDAFGPIADRWAPIMWGCALATMIVGNFAAILQSNIKRLLAYSSIAHAGYVLVALQRNRRTGSAAAMFYLAAYAFTNIRSVRRGDVLFPAKARNTSQGRRFRRARAAPARHGRDADHLPADR